MEKMLKVSESRVQREKMLQWDKKDFDIFFLRDKIKWVELFLERKLPEFLCKFENQLFKLINLHKKVFLY